MSVGDYEVSSFPFSLFFLQEMFYMDQKGKMKQVSETKGFEFAVPLTAKKMEDQMFQALKCPLVFLNSPDLVLLYKLSQKSKVS